MADTVTVEFFFDPGCPWTWVTSRWLVGVAPKRCVVIRWRSLSLAVINRDSAMPAEYSAKRQAAVSALRIVEALRADGCNDEIGAFYTALGARWFHDGEQRSPETVGAIAAEAGFADYAAAGDDPGWDAALEASVEEALARAGPGLGSPIIAIGDEPAIFGPVVAPPPEGEDALRLFDVVCAACRLPGFYELKRGRSGRPDLGPRPPRPG
jgi:2-hydroxychromene-2-carboxylate isomerase